METTKINVTWQDTKSCCDDIANKIKELGVNISAVVSVGRGGLIPSGMIAEKLGIQNVDVINAKYIGEHFKSPVSVSQFDWDKYEGKTILFVDDVVTTGNTFKKIIDQVSDTCINIVVFTASMYQSKHIDNNDMRNIFSKSYDGNTEWLVFPWEV